MKDHLDKQTLELPIAKKRGRPATGKAMTPAEKQRAYRERQAEQKAEAVVLSNAERTAIISLLQDEAREISFRKLSGGPVREDELASAKWLADLAHKIAKV